MNLAEALNTISSLDGFIHLKLRATDHNGLVQCYTVWMSQDSQIKPDEVRILVLNQGEPSETAHIYSTKNIAPVVAFKTVIVDAVEKYQETHPEVEYYEIGNVNEDKKVGRVTLYSLSSNTLTPQSYLLWDKDGTLKFRKID